MLNSRILNVLLCATMFTSAAVAQIDLPSMSGKAEPVMTHIPEGCMGFIIVPNIETMADDVDRFIVNAGLSAFVGAAMPQGALQIIIANLMLGEGFVPEGGFAVVMLDPAPMGINLMQLLPMGPMGGEQSAEKPELPVVILVPGRDIEAVFGNYKIEPVDGEISKVRLRMGEMFAKQQGSYIALSPNRDAFDQLAGLSSKAPKAIPADHMQAIAGADFIIHVDMKLSGPFLSAALQMGEGYANIISMSAGWGGPVNPQIQGMMMAAKILPLVRNAIGQIDSVTVGVKMPETGIVLTQVITFKDETALGTVVSSLKAPPSLVGRLPNLPYILAGGMAYPTEMSDELIGEWMDLWLGMAGQTFSPEYIEALKKISLDSNGLVSAVEFVIGGPPAGNGTFGFAQIITCTDSAKFIAFQVDAFKVYSKMLDLGDGGEGGFTMTYEKGVENIGGLSVDAINITVPELEGANAYDLKSMQKLFGEEKLRLLAAAPDNQTVVMTFGGGLAMMEKTLAVISAGGNIDKDPAVIEALRMMPPKPVGLALLNVGNLWQIVSAFMKAEGMGAMLPDYQFASQAPLAFGAGANGNSLTVSAYVPSAMVKDIVGLVQTIMMRLTGPGAQPAPGPAQPSTNAEDF